MKESKKQREMRTLRAAGMTLANADRMTKTPGGSSAVLIGIAALGLLIMTMLGVYTLNLPGTPDQATAEAVVPAAVVPTPEPRARESVTVAEVAPAQATDTQPLQITPETSPAQKELQWVVALRAEAEAVQPTALQAEEVRMPVVATVQKTDCVSALAADISGTVLQFAPGSAIISAADLDRLNTIGIKTNECAAARVQVAGHSDSSGSDLLNLQLSWERAENTINAMSELGIDVTRFETVGFGSRAPLEQGSDGEDGINRRVELRVIREEARP